MLHFILLQKSNSSEGKSDRRKCSSIPRQMLKKPTLVVLGDKAMLLLRIYRTKDRRQKEAKT